MKIRINDDLRGVGDLRVIGATGEMLGILSDDEAIVLACKDGLDLVEVNPRSKPPLCRIMNFARFKTPPR
jgi:translation initiation factor IF-3